MKLKIKKHIKQFIDYTLTDEFKSMVMIFLVAVSILAVCWGTIMTVFTEDLTNVAIERGEKITELEKSVDYFSGEAARYKMISEEYYELFTTCQDTESWYEKFYYDNVDKYTGEIEGEYYE